jgi:hypothetical protein
VCVCVKCTRGSGGGVGTATEPQHFISKAKCQLGVERPSQLHGAVGPPVTPAVEAAEGDAGESGLTAEERERLENLPTPSQQCCKAIQDRVISPRGVSACHSQDDSQQLRLE